MYKCTLPCKINWYNNNQVFWRSEQSLIWIRCWATAHENNGRPVKMQTRMATMVPYDSHGNVQGLARFLLETTQTTIQFNWTKKKDAEINLSSCGSLCQRIVWKMWMHLWNIWHEVYSRFITEMYSHNAVMQAVLDKEPVYDYFQTLAI